MVHSSIIVVKDAPNVEVEIAGNNESEFVYMLWRVIIMIDVAELYGGVAAPIDPEKSKEDISVRCTITFKNNESRGRYLAVVPFI